MGATAKNKTQALAKALGSIFSPEGVITIKRYWGNSGFRG